MVHSIWRGHHCPFPCWKSNQNHADLIDMSMLRHARPLLSRAVHCSSTTSLSIFNCSLTFRICQRAYYPRGRKDQVVLTEMSKRLTCSKTQEQVQPKGGGRPVLTSLAHLQSSNRAKINKSPVESAAFETRDDGLAYTHGRRQV